MELPRPTATVDPANMVMAGILAADLKANLDKIVDLIIGHVAEGQDKECILDHLADLENDVIQLQEQLRDLSVAYCVQPDTQAFDHPKSDCSSDTIDSP